MIKYIGPINRRLKSIFVGVNGNAVQVWDRSKGIVNSEWFEYIAGNFEKIREMEGIDYESNRLDMVR